LFQQSLIKWPSKSFDKHTDNIHGNFQYWTTTNTMYLMFKSR